MCLYMAYVHTHTQVPVANTDKLPHLTRQEGPRSRTSVGRPPPEHEPRPDISRTRAPRRADAAL